IRNVGRRAGIQQSGEVVMRRGRPRAAEVAFMSTRRHFAAASVVVALSVSFTAPAFAQRASSPARTRVTVISPATAQQTAAQTSPSATQQLPAQATLPAISPARSLQSVPLISTTSVPGLGFDYTHLAARDRNLPVRALIDPVTQHRFALERQALRNAPAVAASPMIFIPISNVVIVQQPPVVVIEPPPAAQSPGPVLAAGPAAPLSDAPAEISIEKILPPAPPVRELDEMLLIRRDGSALRVVAFSANTHRLTYITRDGARRTVALAEIDLDATALANEDRYVPLKIGS
ncbi:MAG TPA: hypothetical protein VNL38_03825, partial [Candidatus Nitrosotenuis sp.]|nr:hypothetical protein [Candidatus Nitrosotenuis sp.]